MSSLADSLSERIPPLSLEETFLTKGYTFYDNAFGEEASMAFKDEITELYNQVMHASGPWDRQCWACRMNSRPCN